jgi:hypothetical protein
MNHTRKQCFVSVLIGSEVRKAADFTATNFRTGTLMLDHLAAANGIDAKAA